MNRGSTQRTDMANTQTDPTRGTTACTHRQDLAASPDLDGEAALVEPHGWGNPTGHVWVDTCRSAVHTSNLEGAGHWRLDEG